MSSFDLVLAAPRFEPAPDVRGATAAGGTPPREGAGKIGAGRLAREEQQVQDRR